MARRLNPRLVKIHRSYTVEEVANLFGAHKNTVRIWMRKGLAAVDDRRPTLIHGLDLVRFIEARRRSAKQPCPSGQMYCLKCRVPKAPAAAMADYLPFTETTGNLRGLCPTCGTLMHRRVAFSKLKIVGANLEIAFPEGVSRIRESAVPSLNCDSSNKGDTYEDPQPRERAN